MKLINRSVLTFRKLELDTVVEHEAYSTIWMHNRIYDSIDNYLHEGQLVLRGINYWGIQHGF